ncbi:MAG TPA: 16S rRNA (guanine(966)-N(2))-methyltransferase RsmD [Micavibrio sp.]|nr:16S rRNA (guanine(966)-N(2))-methyltransferase RsmD [Micavibrio sp.]
MRITGGEYRGRLLQSPRDRAIRPTSDKVRQAVFNILYSRGVVEGAAVLDAFCGTGALGLEALSRGALCCTFMDKNRASLRLAQDNFAALKMSAQHSFVLKDAAKPGIKPPDMTAANLVFLDPPYKQGLIAQAIAGLTAGGWLAAEACLLMESEKGLDFAALEGCDVLMVRDYGDTRVALAQKTGKE